MSAALAIATLSFSVRLPRLLPSSLRHPVVYALPTLMVLATMSYWLWRVSSKRKSGEYGQTPSRSSADEPYVGGSGVSFNRKYTPSCAR